MNERIHHILFCLAALKGLRVLKRLDTKVSCFKKAQLFTSFTTKLNSYKILRYITTDERLEIRYVRVCVYFALHGPFHGVLLLLLQVPGDLLPLHDPRLDEEEDGGDVHHDHPHEGEPEAPGEIVVLPVGHEVSTVAHRSKDDQGDRSAGGSDHEVKADPSENLDPAVVVYAEQVHHHHSHRHQHPHEAYREEELGCHEERRHKEVSYFVVSFCERIEDPSTASVELCVGQIVVILQASEAVGPQTDLLNLGPIEPRVSLNPGRRHKGGDDEDHTDNSDRKSCVTCQRSLPLHIGVR